MLRRAIERGETPPTLQEESGTNKIEETRERESTQPGDTMTSKERRLAKRAAERCGTALSIPAEDEKVIPAQANEVSGELITSKERRLARRAAERSGTSLPIPEEVKVVPQPVAEAGRRRNAAPLIVFVGQLAFTTTAAGLESHFRKRGEMPTESLKVRLLTHPGTGKSKGTAFVEVEDPATLYRCLALHHTNLDGRIINVERTAGGSSRSKGRKEKLGELRAIQKETMAETVARIMGEFIASGALKEGELDADCIRVLEKFDGKVVRLALDEYCAKSDKATLRNPSAYFVYSTHKIAFDQEAAAQAAAAAKEREASAAKTGAKRKRPGDSNDVKKDGSKVRGAKDTTGSDSKASSRLHDESDNIDDAGADRKRTRKEGKDKSEDNDGKGSGLASIFPSLRGRGGGLMNRGTRGPTQTRQFNSRVSSSEDHMSKDKEESIGDDKRSGQDASIAPEGVVGDGMTAKERRAAKRASERANAEPPAATA